MKITKLVLGLILAIAVSSCGTTKNKSGLAEKKQDYNINNNSSTAVFRGEYPVVKVNKIIKKKSELKPFEIKRWAHKDIINDTIPGLSIDKAYHFLKDRKGETVVVGVIDSGIDIEHKDLKNQIWTNTNEIPNNGIDDDKNGYIDDIHGWNFLGGKEGYPIPEQLEMTRIVKKYMNNNTEEEGSDRIELKGKYDQYTNLKKKVAQEYQDAKKNYEHYSTLLASIRKTDKEIKKALFKRVYSVDDIVHFNYEDKATREGKDKLIEFIMNKKDINEGMNELQRKIDRSESKFKYYYNVDFKGRKTEDNPDNIKDVPYGNNYVIGSKKHEIHGTHVSGIICAERDNGIGMNGVTDNVALMSLRAVPDGDEYDKDIALAIRYAADNGAKVVNMSFIKSYSPHKDWVFKAIEYAASKDVLLVHAAGNDYKNMDYKNVFPNDSRDKSFEFSDNVITVGAISRNLDTKLVAYFSNYGKKNVDVFAPGVEIYATFPDDNYKAISGTSMAAPQVAGVAALIRSYYPNLSASEVKHIIMNSGVSINKLINKPGDKQKERKLVDFKTLSVSGKIVNAYNALLLADKMSKKNK
jgi:subtilisin family serine protease